MKFQKIAIVLIATGFFCFLLVPLARAIRPLFAPYAVLAGCQYTAGYQDGSFNTARFNQPLGLTVSGDGNRLFVADSLNNRIRVVHLDQENKVETVAGQALPGKTDGPVSQAQFQEPRGVLYLPGDYLAVNDFGNQSLRFVDLKAGMVTTYRGDPVHLDGSDTPKPNAMPTSLITPSVLLNGIKDMAYLPAIHSIVFTRPEAGVLNALNLGTGQLSVILKDNAQLPHPSALWIQDNKIYVADRDLLSVYSMDWKNNAVENMQSAGTPLAKVLSLSFSDNTLYGLLAKDGYPVQRFLLDKRYSHPTPCLRCQADDMSNGMVKFNNGWGDYIPPEKYPEEPIQANSPWASIVPDPSCKRRFFYSLPDLDIIVSLRDLFEKGGYNAYGLLGGEYPTEKPKNTYRILICGSCQLTDTDGYLFPTDSHPMPHPTNAPFFPENLSMVPQMEHEFNFQAALDDNPLNYEFLNFARHGDQLFWPTNEAPDEAKKFDVDLVMVLGPQLDLPVFMYYFNYNLTPDGVPQSPPDPEYVLKPPQERIPDGLPRKFYDYCKEHNLVQIKGKGFDWSVDMYKDPKVQDMIMDFWAKPWVVLNRKLSSMRTSGGKPVRFLVVCGYMGAQTEENCQPKLFEEAARRSNTPFLYLGSYMNALHLSYYPMMGTGHMDPNGAIFLGKLLAKVLPKKGLIPWPTPERTPIP